MDRAAFIRVATIFILVASAFGCAQTVRQYTQGPAGQAIIRDVSEEDYWRQQVDERVAEEKAGKSPPAYDNWPEYYHWWFGVLRRKHKAPFKSAEFKTSDDLVNYIKEKRRAKRLPELAE